MSGMLGAGRGCRGRTERRGFGRAVHLGGIRSGRVSWGKELALAYDGNEAG